MTVPPFEYPAALLPGIAEQFHVSLRRFFRGGGEGDRLFVSSLARLRARACSWCGGDIAPVRTMERLSGRRLCRLSCRGFCEELGGVCGVNTPRSWWLVIDSMVSEDCGKDGASPRRMSLKSPGAVAKSSPRYYLGRSSSAGNGSVN